MKNKKRKENAGTGFRILFCIGIVCAAIAIKHIDPPFVGRIVETVSRDFRIEEAIEAISRTGDIGGDAIEVFGEAENGESAFDESFYIDREKTDAYEKELEEAKEKAEQEKKELSVETLSFFDISSIFGFLSSAFLKRLVILIHKFLTEIPQFFKK